MGHIFTTSIQHTGTWFIIRFLQNFIPNFIEANLINGVPRKIEEDHLIHAHFSGINNCDFTKSLELGAIWFLSSLFPTVIPIRDPLAAILSRESRHPEQRHFYIVEGFIKMQQTLFSHPNVMFVPIDLPQTPDERFKVLSDVLVHCKIEPEPHKDLLMKCATEWGVENANPQNRFKKMYAEKDMAQIEFLLGPKTAEVEYLKNNSPTIFVNFLQHLGYKRKDLLW